MINIEKFLKENADFYYGEFNRKFVFSSHTILGVRIPILKKFAKQIEPEYINLDKKSSHEEILLYGFSAGEIQNEDEQLEYLQNVLPFIDNWSTCDSIVCAMKCLKGEKSYNFFLKLLESNKEFFVRVGLVGFMRYFLESNNLHEILSKIRGIQNDAYYVKMAISWLYAELCVKNFQYGKEEIENCKDDFIKSKAISKARESFRLTKEQKEELLFLKK